MSIAQTPCYNCFAERQGTEGACPGCGYDHAETASKYPVALKAGGILNGQYIIGRVLGQGGFGITYLAFDYQLKIKVAIKEYMPDGMATRLPGTTLISAYSGERQESFAYGAERFLDEARVLARFIGNRNIAGVKSYFNENGTCYFVMDYVEGISFKNYISNKKGKIDYQDALRILTPVLRALAAVHREGFIHRDITPDNIYITKEDEIKLLDFGSARYSLGDKSKSLDVILKAGYAPKEQYLRRGKQGPWTDVYSVAACFYASITGYLPPEALERAEEDELAEISARGIKLPVYLDDAIMKGLEVRAEDRFQSAEEFLEAIEAGQLREAEAAQMELQPIPEPRPMPDFSSVPEFLPSPVKPATPVVLPIIEPPREISSSVLIAAERRISADPAVTEAAATEAAATVREPDVTADAAPEKTNGFIKIGKTLIEWIKKNKIVAGVLASAAVMLIVALPMLIMRIMDEGGEPAAAYAGAGGGAAQTMAAAATPRPTVKPTPSPTPALPRGNAAGNIINNGYAAISEGWLYYRNGVDGKLYKCRANGAEVTKLSDDRDNAFSINIIGDWIYYSNADDHNHPYRMRTDGTGRMSLGDFGTSYMNIVGDWIYYMNRDDDYKLYRASLDGSVIENLVNEMVRRFYVTGDWIYYYGDKLPGSETNEKMLYKLSMDGKTRESLFAEDFDDIIVLDGWIYYNDSSSVIHRIRENGLGKVELGKSYWLNVQDGWIYYANIDDVRNLYKMKLDGTGSMRLNDDWSGSINVAGDWIYYYNYNIASNSTLCRIRADGTGNEIIGIDPAARGNAMGNIANGGLTARQGGWIYYRNPDDGGKLYKVRTDGTGETKINDDIPTNINVVGNWIYYTYSWNMYKCRLDGSERKRLGGDSDYDWLTVIGDKIYFCDVADGRICSMSAEDGSGLVVLNNYESTDVVAADGWVYYSNRDENDAVYRVRADGTQDTRIGKYRGEFFNLVDDWLYFRNLTEGGWIYKMRADGTGDATAVHKANSLYVNVADDWIYFANDDDGGKLYKIGVDGKGKEKLSDNKALWISVIEEWVYYAVKNDDDTYSYYRTSIDGKTHEDFNPGGNTEG